MSFALGVGLGHVAPPSSLTFVSLFGFQAARACTKHLSGIVVGAFLPLRVPETLAFPRSSNQVRAGSGSRREFLLVVTSSSWFRARERGRARWRGALRHPTNVWRGGESPIKANGCRAGPGGGCVLRKLRCAHKSSNSSRRGLGPRFLAERGSSWTAGSLPSAPLLLARQEALHVEGPILAQHEVDGPAQLGGQDRERLGLAVSSGDAPEVSLAFGVLAQEE